MGVGVGVGVLSSYFPWMHKEESQDPWRPLAAPSLRHYGGTLGAFRGRIWARRARKNNFTYFGTILGQRVLREIIGDPPKSLVFWIECPKTHLLQRGHGEPMGIFGVFRVPVQGVHFGPARRYGRSHP